MLIFTKRKNLYNQKDNNIDNTDIHRQTHLIS